MRRQIYIQNVWMQSKKKKKRKNVLFSYIFSYINIVYLFYFHILLRESLWDESCGTKTSRSATRLILVWEAPSSEICKRIRFPRITIVPPETFPITWGVSTAGRPDGPTLWLHRCFPTAVSLRCCVSSLPLLFGNIHQISTSSTKFLRIGLEVA